jgi:hypothetical protein
MRTLTSRDLDAATPVLMNAIHRCTDASSQPPFGDATIEPFTA